MVTAWRPPLSDLEQIIVLPKGILLAASLFHSFSARAVYHVSEMLAISQLFRQSRSRSSVEARLSVSLRNRLSAGLHAFPTALSRCRCLLVGVEVLLRASSVARSRFHRLVRFPCAPRAGRPACVARLTFLGLHRASGIRFEKLPALVWVTGQTAEMTTRLSRF